MRGHDLAQAMSWYKSSWSRSHVIDEQMLSADMLIFLICRGLVGLGGIEASLTRRKRA